MTAKIAKAGESRAALLKEWGRLSTLVEKAENDPATKPVELVALWRQLYGLSCELH
jgi:hypothetical protein